MMELIENIVKVHTTELGQERIKRNLDIQADPVKYCVDLILDKETTIVKKGKNWYCVNNDIIITVNSYSYTIITASRKG